MISGAMPKRKLLFHAGSAILITLIFVSAGLVNAQFLLPKQASRVSPGFQLVAFLFILLAVAILAIQNWFRRRIIREFTYDGATLRFSTLASSATQARLPSQLIEIRDWMGRGGVMGYQLFFRDAPKAFLEDDTSNSTALIDQLLKDMTRHVPAPAP